MYVTPDSIAEPLYVITAVSNTQRFKSRWKLYRRFKRYVEASGAILVTVEANFGERAYALDGVAPEYPSSEDACGQGNPHLYVKVNAQDELWFKENLLNIGLQRLTQVYPNAKYIAWIDHDVVFARPNWVGEAIHKLQHYDFIQMWSEAQDLGPAYESSKKHRGFMACYADGIPWEPGLYGSEGTGSCPMNWHPGFAWAARRDALDAVGGFIDFGILGAGDRHMACSLVCRLEDSIAPGLHPEYIDRLQEWQFRAERNVRLNVGCMSGLLLHYWHGKKRDRRYMDRWQILVKHQYRPSTDIKPNSQGVYQLCDHGDMRSAQLRDDIRRYFQNRNEDSTDE